MTIFFGDLVAGKLLVQAGLRSAEQVRADLAALDRDSTVRGYLERLRRAGHLDEAWAARIARWVARYERVRREALFAGLLERAGIVTSDELELYKDRLDAEGYSRALSTLVREAGRLDAATEQRLVQQQAMGLERESERLLATYRRNGFQAVDRPLTKDPNARVETGVFTIRKLFRSAESQRLARASELLAAAAPPTRAATPPSGIALPRHEETGTMRYQPLAYEQTAQFDAAQAQAAIAADRRRAEQAPTVHQDEPGEARADGFPERIGDLDVEGIIGSGGMGIVLRARRAASGEEFAIKVARDRQREVVERFRREALATSLIHHENVVRAFGSGALEDGTPYMVLELVNGRELRELLRERGIVPPREALSVMVQVLAALEASHAAGVLHRDVKPENVLISEIDGRLAAKLMDFGLARIERDVVPDAEGVFQTMTTDVVSGSPPYLAPEQIMGQPVSPRTDLYAVGVVLFEMVTGQLPFVAKSLSGYVRAHVTKPAPTLAETKPGVPYADPLEKLVASLLAKEPEKRPPSARAVLELIEREVAPALAPSAEEFAATQMDEAPRIALPSPETRGITRVLARLWKKASGGDHKPPPPKT